MLSSSDSLTVTAPPRERFAFPRSAAPRSTEPEVFTFERIPAAATALRSFVPIRPKRRCTRVMYPAKVRMHLPPPERSPAKRWLLLLVLVVLWQIYTEDPCADAPTAAAADAAAGDFQGFSFQSAEQLSGPAALAAAQPAAAAEDAAAASASASSAAAAAAGGTCAKSGQSSEGSRPYEQSAGMVALLVYHRLGADN